MKKWLLLLLLVAFFLDCGGKKIKTVPGHMTPGTPEYMLNEGVNYLNRGQYDLAENKIMAALAKNPQLVNAYYSLGLIHLYRQDMTKAIPCFEKAVAINPRYYDAYNMLGVIYSEQGDFEKAKYNLLLAANGNEYTHPENAYHNLALLEEKLGRTEAALNYIEKGLKLSNRFTPLYVLKGKLLEKQNKLQEALNCYESAYQLQVAPEIEPLLHMGRILPKLGQKKKALQILEEALGKFQEPGDKQQIVKLLQEIEKEQ